LSDRVRLVALPACALSTPSAPACQKQTPVQASTDPATGRLTATLQLPPTPAPAPASRTAASGAGSTTGSRAMVLAAQSVPAGSAGTYAATPTNPSNQWSQGGATGGFDYSYPIAVPPPLGGSAPTVSLNYSSQSVDGQTAATNNQASWIGDGWSYDPGYIERAYQPCNKDGISGSGDLCWAAGGFEVSLNQAGIGGQLVHDDGSAGWHISGDRGATVKLVTTDATNNGAYNNEYWVITTQDGTRYYYGAGHLPTAEGGTGHDLATNSAWTAPIYCPKSGDPCYNSGTGTSSYAGNMAYRWNLDYVIDPHGNTTVYSYNTETNYYARGSTHTLTPYVRGGYLKQANYGWRTGDVATGTAKSAAQVAFTTGQRCTGSATECASYSNLNSSTATDWPDTPFDQICQSTGTCTNYSPSFFSTYALTQIQTLVNKNGTYAPVDTYKLANTMLDPGDFTGSQLWLNSITHTGNDGAPISLPAVSFTPYQYANRVPNSGTWPDYWHPRIVAITDETGAEIAITYTTTTPSAGACSQSPSSPVLPTPSNDTMLCYQQYWTPPGSATAISDWFEKYVVSQVSLTSLVDTTPGQTTNYAYGGAPAWHRNDSPLTPSDQRTWDQFRGFSTLTTTTGTAPDPITQTTTSYLRGMDGDYTSQTGTGRRTVTVTDSAGDTVTDADQYADTVLETDTYDHAGGTVQDAAISLPWSAQTASHAHTAQANLPAETAQFVNTTTTLDRQRLTSGAWRTSKQVNVFSSTTGLLQHSDKQGDTSLINRPGSQETCATTTYATPPGGQNAGMRNYAARTTTVSVPTGGPIGTGACPTPTASNTLADALTYYDNNANPGVITSVGNISKAQVIDHYTGSTPGYVTVSSGLGYDTYGRPTSSADARGLVTNTTYTAPQTGQLPSSIATNVPAYSLTTTTTLDQLRQLPTKVVDPNGNTTSESYDGLGRLINVWKPGRTVTQSANLVYSYGVNGTASPSWIETRTLRDNNAYSYGYTILNGFGQTRQTQIQTVDGNNGSLVTDTFYDTHGWPTKVTNPYPIAAFPFSKVYDTSDDQVPGETLTTYDGRGRATTSAFYAKAQFQWQTTAAYPGADRTDVTPATGGTATSTFTDALGQTSALWNYTTATPTGNTADARVITYAHDAAGRVTTVTGPSGEQWTSTYDPRGHVVQKTDPDAGASSSTYYPDGDPQTSTDSTGRQLTYTYDSLGRKTELYAGAYTATPDPTTIQDIWTYDTATAGKGQPATATSYSGGSGPTGIAYTETITGYTNRYAPTGSSVTIPSNVAANEQQLAGTYSTAMTYLPVNGQLKSIQYIEPANSPLPNETVTNAYDAFFNLNAVSGLADYQTSATTDGYGKFLTVNLGDMPNQVTVTTNYDPATGRPHETFVDKETGSAHVDDITATYNTAGQTTAVKDIQDGTGTDLQCYGYDHLGELINAWTDNGGLTTQPDPSIPDIGHCTTQTTPDTTPTAANLGGPAPYWQTYGYNTAGDRTSENDHDVSGNTANDLTRIFHYNNAGAANELSDQQHGAPSNLVTDSYTYFPNGDTKTRTIAGQSAQTFTYTAQDQTAAISDGSGNASTYTYDAAGGLLLQSDIGKNSGTVTLYLAGEQLTLNTTTSTVTGTRNYALSDGATETRSSTGALTYQFGNGQNTQTLFITADANQKETRRAYTPYGTPRGNSPAWINNRAFLDQPADPTTGLDLLGARNYDPTAGRFLQVDPLLETTDALQLGGYTYAGNNPIGGADPSGLRDDPMGKVADVAAVGDKKTAEDIGQRLAHDYNQNNGGAGNRGGSCDRSCQWLKQPSPRQPTMNERCGSRGVVASNLCHKGTFTNADALQYGASNTDNWDWACSYLLKVDSEQCKNNDPFVNPHEGKIALVIVGAVAIVAGAAACIDTGVFLCLVAAGNGGQVVGRAIIAGASGDAGEPAPEEPIKWPPNDGFHGNPAVTVLQPGTLVDRFGYDGGRFVSPNGSSITGRALAPGTTAKPYTVFEVTNRLVVRSGPAEPWFGEDGMGTQYYLPASVSDLIDSGYLRPVS
jgi:RHS repeat-associated protein